MACSKPLFPLLKRRTGKKETAKVKKLLIQRDLIDPFDKTPLGNFDKFTLQVQQSGENQFQG
jgi:hypothetical protein